MFSLKAEREQSHYCPYRNQVKYGRLSLCMVRLICHAKAESDYVLQIQLVLSPIGDKKLRAMSSKT